MFDESNDRQQISVLSVIGGFLLGLLLCLPITVFGFFFVGGIRNATPFWALPLFDALAAIAIAAVAFRQFRSSGFARGVVIAMALAVLLNGICGVASRR